MINKKTEYNLTFPQALMEMERGKICTNEYDTETDFRLRKFSTGMCFEKRYIYGVEEYGEYVSSEDYVNGMLSCMWRVRK